MRIEISAISGWMVLGWELDPSDSLRLELRRIEFETQLSGDYAKCEILFRALSSLTAALASGPGNPIVVKAVKTSKNSAGEDVIEIDCGNSGSIALSAKEHIAFVY